MKQLDLRMRIKRKKIQTFKLERSTSANNERDRERNKRVEKEFERFYGNR